MTALRFNVECPTCGQLLDTYTLDELPSHTWSEAACWGYIATVNHQPHCPANTPATADPIGTRP